MLEQKDDVVAILAQEINKQDDLILRLKEILLKEFDMFVID